eukprot:TRINITY_DN105285_c0_g1_i1.p1 TRINITY_DN105285_c0_g1~~TRINITY_DN105285_c0_g1_i1.p1  ORF type:complete len:414 (-),score=67.27 TRINITY_DN105285_c0_g1_i1:70-1287(-)
MGHRASRERCLRQETRSAPETSARADAATEQSAAKAQLPFRCEDRSKIPDALVQGPFEDFSITEDVYATFYLLARNATPDMYSISPFKNPELRIAWLYLLFITGSQLFVIAAITILYPPTVQREVAWVDCSNATAVEALHAQGFFDAPAETACLAASAASLEADVRGVTVTLSNVERTVPFHAAVLVAGGPLVQGLRAVCCSWVFSQVYFRDFASVKALLGYHDFSRWFVPLKGQEVRNSWAVIIPFLQYSVVLIVATVSFLVICAFDEPFDIVMNSLAFTFIVEVGSFFNEPLVRRMAETNITGFTTDHGGSKYLYPEYRLSNAINEDGTYTDEGWYICDDEEKAGLLSDYKVRHNENAYPRPRQRTVRILEILIFLIPAMVVLCVAMRCGAFGEFLMMPHWEL